MAKPAQLGYQIALDGIAKEKYWPAGQAIQWNCRSIKKLPAAYSFRGGLLVDGVQPEGLFVELYYKSSPIPGVPASIKLGLLVQNCLVMALHENGVSRHQNHVGAGLPHYRKTIGHPHFHIPVEGASYGYCEPVERLPVEELWYYFLGRANIIGAPKLNLPGGDQGELNL